MIKDKATHWVHDEDGFIYSNGERIADFDINDDDIEDRENRKEMAISAVNNTYGQNIDPEAVPDLLKALHDYEDGTSLSVCFNCLIDLIPAEKSWIKWLKKQGVIIDAAIAKSKLPTND